MASSAAGFLATDCGLIGRKLFGGTMLGNLVGELAFRTGDGVFGGTSRPGAAVLGDIVDRFPICLASVAELLVLSGGGGLFSLGRGRHEFLKYAEVSKTLRIGASRLDMSLPSDD